ncbi:MAG TPA: hypothetical protein VMW27_17620, partial [Thermoanaerobaculia bacterium]|nr:hypothetical protein [Thermoanaerobaculia bacterium]
MSRLRWALFAFLLLAAAAVFLALWLGRTAPKRLTLNRPVRVVLLPGAAPRWSVDLAPGQHAEVEVRSPARVSAVLIDLAGRSRYPFHETDEGQWSAGWVAEERSRWTIEVRLPAAGPAVACVLKLTTLRPATPRDRLAWRLDRLDDRWRVALKAGGDRAEAATPLVSQAVALREELHRGDRFGLV